ncbi:hypothetical protein [Thalassomonas haliotis]|uniref:Response regulator receiver protein n=1 Tax=Thalassomonas haliotis TaxID=485448 RepID=A0ABY7VFR7_9GAMM|nr:hypothetical protein [Thalassomonas haliotis]WDE11860.1 hypothetical protein H3N35_27350 [Thalassomonas haliotis]
MEDNKLNIVYIDEEHDQLADFQADAELSGLFEEIYLLEPKSNLDEMVTEILELKVDAVISDFALNEAKVINYNGDQLLNAIQDIRHNFPCFLRTSYEDDAVSNSFDVNRVYVKEESMELHSESNLFKRVAAQISAYHRRFEAIKLEHINLRHKLAKEGLNSQETDRLIELDDLIESLLSAETKTPTEVKKLALSKFDALMNSTDKLINDIEANLKGNSSDA